MATSKKKPETKVEVQLADDATAPAEPKEITVESFNKARTVINVALKPITRRTIEITVGGDSLIVHAWGPKAIKEMLLQQQMTTEEKRLAKKHREKKDPKADFEDAKCMFKGKPAFPTLAFKLAMVNAGALLGIPKPAIRAAVFVKSAISTEFVEIKSDKCVMREDPVRVGPYNNRVADLRYRPEYPNWRVTLQIIYRDDLLTAEQVVALAQNAGFSVGVGEWRVEKNGQHGTFEVING
jgi:hypothetical protein